MRRIKEWWVVFTCKIMFWFLNKVMRRHADVGYDYIQKKYDIEYCEF